MAITTYANLQTAINYRIGNRSDADLTTRTPEYIALCESEMQRRLETVDQEIVSTLSTTSGSPTVALPTGFQRARLLRLSFGGVYTEIGLFAASGQGSTYIAGSGVPVQASIVGTNLRINPTPDSVYTLFLDYWGKFSPLSTNNTSNWILADHPDAYLYGSMAHAFYGMGGLARGDSFLTKFIAIMDDINQASFEAENSNTLLRTDIGIAQRRHFNIRTG